MECDGVADTPEDGPAREADFQIVAEVEVCFLAVVPGASRVVMPGQLSQYDVETIGSERWDKRKWVRTSGYKAKIVGWLSVTGESQGSHSRGPPVELLLANGERVARKCNASIEFDRT